MATLFISDLHLSGERPAIGGLFLQFLQERASSAGALYILGDLFEAWLGDDVIPPDVQPIISALKQLSDQGTSVYIMHGNRDFLLGDDFASLCGATLLDDPCVIDLYGTPTLLMHGDLLCTDDIPYQQMRTMLRAPQWIEEFLAKPVDERIAFAQSLRQRSQKETGEKDEAIMDVNADTLRDTLQQYQVSQLIHGHTHRPAIHREPSYTRFVLGDWYEKGSVLSCDENGCELNDL